MHVDAVHLRALLHQAKSFEEIAIAAVESGWRWRVLKLVLMMAALIHLHIWRSRHKRGGKPRQSLGKLWRNVGERREMGQSGRRQASAF